MPTQQISAHKYKERITIRHQHIFLLLRMQNQKLFMHTNLVDRTRVQHASRTQAQEERAESGVNGINGVHITRTCPSFLAPPHNFIKCLVNYTSKFVHHNRANTTKKRGKGTRRRDTHNRTQSASVVAAAAVAALRHEYVKSVHASVCVCWRRLYGVDSAPKIPATASINWGPSPEKPRAAVLCGPVDPK